MTTRRTRPACAVLLCLVGAVASPRVLARASESEISPETRRAIEAVLRRKADGLLAEKDADGVACRRGSFSRSFRRVDDATIRVGFERDTAEPESLLTERFLLTLRKNSAGVWSVVAEEPQDSVRALTRGVRSGAAFHRFESFSFRKEGLKVTATRGSYYTETRAGRVEGFTLAAADLAYEYAPPLEQDRLLLDVHRKSHEADLVFTPAFLDVQCDPVSCDRLLSESFTGATGIPPEQAGAGLRQDYRDAVDEERKARRADAFADFSLPYAPDERYYTLSLADARSDHVARLEYDNRQPKEVSMKFSGFGDWEYYSEETRASGAPPDQLERRPDEEGRDYDLESLHGTVEMAVGDGELMTGDLTFGLKALADLDRIFFSIAQLHDEKSARREARNPRMTIDSVQDGEGRELTWVKTGAVSGLLILPRTVPAGSRLTLRLQFENRDSIIKISSSYSYVDREGWLPLVRYGDMIPDFDLTLKVPARYTTLSVGRKVSETKQDGLSITRWVAENPVVFPTAIFGVYTEDVSVVKAVRKDGTAIPVRIHFDKDSAGSIALKSLRALADQAANALNLYSTLFGTDYPYSKLDLVNTPEGLTGQSPSSMVYLGNDSFMSQGMLGMTGGASATRFADSLVAHEVAHQWWGSLIAPANEANYWWVESLAEYSAALYLEAAHGKAAYQGLVDDWRREALQDDVWDTVQDGEGIYDKGAYIFHMLRCTFGDEAFFRFLKSLAVEMKGREIVTRDIQKVAEEALGTGAGGLEWFFDQWVRGVGLPELTFAYAIRTAEDGSQTIEGRVDQRIMVTTKAPAREVLPGRTFKALGTVTLIGRNGAEYRKRLVIEGPSTSFTDTLPEALTHGTRLKQVTFNKLGDILAYDVIVKEETRGR